MAFEWDLIGVLEELPEDVASYGLGWIPPERRTAEEQEEHEKILAEMPPFETYSTGAFGGIEPLPEKAFLWELAKKVNKGEHFPCLYQKTGSCVGQGATNAVYYLTATDAILRNDPDEVLLPFVGYHYGRGRFHAGIRGRGDGSTGSGQAKAVRVDGVLPAILEGLPKPLPGKDITWGSQVEYEWSDGARIDASWVERGKKHPVQTTAQIRTTDQAAEALASGYPITIASMWGGQMRPKVQGDPPVLLNRRVTQWAHQMVLIAFWNHPQFGKIYYVLNSWGGDTHGVCPSGAPPGGFWIREEDAQSIFNEGESFAFSQYLGFPKQNPWLLI